MQGQGRAALIIPDVGFDLQSSMLWLTRLEPTNAGPSKRLMPNFTLRIAKVTGVEILARLPQIQMGR